MVLRWLFPSRIHRGEAELDLERRVCGPTQRSLGSGRDGEGGNPSLICSCPPPAPGWSEAMAVDGAGKTGAEEAQPPKGKGEREQSRQEEEEMAEAPQGLFRGGKSGPLEQEEEERLSEEWEDSKRWSKMDQLANELTAEKRLDREDEEDDPDRSMKLSFQDQGYGFRGPGMQLRRGWRPSSREDSVEAGLPLQARGYPEEKKEEEGSANRRPEVGMEWELAPGVLAQLGEEGQLHSDVWPLPHWEDTVPLEPGTGETLRQGALGCSPKAWAWGRAGKG